MLMFNRFVFRTCGTLLLLLVSRAGFGADIYHEQGQLIRAPRAIAALGGNIFGDKVNLYTGALEFVQTDVSLPGNNALPVSVGRRLITGNYGLSTPKQFGSWDLEIPHLHGTFADAKGWVTSANSNQRCTTFGAPPIASSSFGGSGLWNADEYWHGNYIYVPGVGDQEMLTRSASTTLTSANVVTRSMWTFTCNTLQSVGSVSRDNGEGFTATSPDGLIYRFDWLAKRVQDPIEKASTAPQGQVVTPVAGAVTPSPDAVDGEMLARTEVWIMPTQVTDRFGNWVRYTYDATNKWQLTRIESSDGRVITLTYNAGTTQIASVNDGTRTWGYAYSGNTLTVVTLPDSTTWQLGGVSTLLADLNYQGGGDCENAGLLDPQVLSGSMSHPSGATVTFELTPTPHGRSYVDKACRGPTIDPGGYNLYPRYFDTFSLTKKTLTGAGLPSGGLVWSYAYGVPNASWSTCVGCPNYKHVMMTEPDNSVTRYTFGNRFRVNEGSLLSTEFGLAAGTGETGGTPLRTVALRYAPFASPVGTTAQKRGDGDFNAIINPVDQRQTVQQGNSFVWTGSNFTELGNPRNVTRASSLGMTRQETTAYVSNTTKWVLDQVDSVTEVSTGKVMVKNVYHPTTAMLTSVSHFGHLDETMAYNTDGTLANRKDGLNQQTTYSNYKRGLPQNVGYANATAISAVVNNIGTVASTTDENSFTTAYGYDAMGRLASITYPASDTVAWQPTLIQFSRTEASQYDLGPGHWLQTITTGNGRTTTYYDALWRPVITETADLGNVAATIRIVKRQYDADGKLTFESYPKRDFTSITEGRYFEFDALDRPTTTSTISELGVLYSGFNYPTGAFQRIETSARGIDTTHSFQAFDEPSYDAVTGAVMPEGVNLSIVRDVFGKPKSVTRSGGGKSAVRSYVYDTYQRLCKTIEPESGSTVQDYDLANNVAWRASGLALPSTTACDTASVAAASKVSFGYDTLNRLTATTYGDASPGITRTYTADGLPFTITSNGSVWTNTYNKRRLNERESLAYGGSTYNIDRTYNANAALSKLTYPDGTAVSYTPNALGEATQAGSYASAITYHPNGAIASFNYGNGIAHTLQQNVRGLPEWSTDAGVLRDNYQYDKNANVTAILDWQLGVSNLESTYDNLDRLKSVYSAPQWGTSTYSYDALDNLTSTNYPSGATARSTTHNYNSTTNRLTNIASATTAYNLGYSYDVRGNITQRGSQVFVFDLGNRLQSATGKGTYAYDGLGHRVSAVGTDGVNRVLVYSQDGQLLFSRVTTLPITAGTKYIYLHKHVIAESSPTATQYDHTNGVGSPVARTSSTGALISRTRYEPFGLTASGAVPDIGFTGHVNAPDIGLVYMQQRYYDPVAGRMLSIDPVTTDADSGGSFNRYAYANNNPYRYIDPDGRDARDDQIAKDLRNRRESDCGGGAYCSASAFLSGVGDRFQTAYLANQKQIDLVGEFDENMCVKTHGGPSICMGAGAIRAVGARVTSAVIPIVGDSKLGNLISDLYKGARGPNPIGTGSTADAIRNELKTGLPTAGKFHSEKGLQYVRGLDNWLKNNLSAAHYDRLVAKSVRDDLINALGGKP
jgi:RHS repeat-associated protein